MENETVNGWKSQRKKVKKVWKRIDTERKHRKEENEKNEIVFSGDQIFWKNISHLLAENIFFGLLVAENKMFYAALNTNIYFV